MCEIRNDVPANKAKCPLQEYSGDEQSEQKYYWCTDCGIFIVYDYCTQKYEIKVPEFDQDVGW